MPVAMPKNPPKVDAKEETTKKEKQIKSLPPYYKPSVLSREVALFNNATNSELEYEEVDNTKATGTISLGISKDKDGKKKIIAVINGGQPPVEVSATNGKKVWLNPRTDVAKDEIDLHNLINHELAHVLFKSNKAIPQRLSRDFEKIPPEAIFDIYNILEDARIEAGWGRIFGGTVEGFNNLKNNLLDNITQQIKENYKGKKVDNPMAAILVARAAYNNEYGYFDSQGNIDAENGNYGHNHKLDDIVNKMTPEVQDIYNSSKEHMANLHSKDYLATYIEEGALLDELKDFYKNQKKEKQEGGNQNGQGQSGGQQGQGQQGKGQKQKGSKSKASGQGQGQGSSQGEMVSLTEEEIKQLIEEHIKEIEAASELLDSESKNFEDPEESEEAQVEKAGKEIAGNFPSKTKQMPQDAKDAINKINKESNQRQTDKEKEAQKAYGELGSALIENHLDEVNTEPRLSKTSTLPKILPSSKIRQKLTNIKSRYEEEKMKSGRRLDINRVIQNRLSSTPDMRVFNKPDLERGVEFYVLLDLSGSMAGEKLQTEKEILATLYDSIIPYNRNVKIKMYGYEGDDLDMNGRGRESTVFEFDRKKLGLLAAGGGTPTGTGLVYIGKQLNKNPSVYKNLILITDGQPNGLFDEPSEKIIRDQISKIRKLGANVFTIFLDAGSTAQIRDRMKTVFSSANKNYNIDKSKDSRKILEDVIVDDITRRLMA